MMDHLTGSIITRAMCGERRCYHIWRIHEALARRGTTSAALARELGISTAAVSRTLTGKNHSPRILEALRDAGVPEEYLFDPRRMGGEGAQTPTQEGECGIH